MCFLFDYKGLEPRKNKYSFIVKSIHIEKKILYLNQKLYFLRELLVAVTLSFMGCKTHKQKAYFNLKALCLINKNCH